jgi:predicted secreted protein
MMKKGIALFIIVGMLLLNVSVFGLEGAVGSAPMDEEIPPIREWMQITEASKLLMQERLLMEVPDKLYFLDTQRHWSREYVRSAYSWGLLSGYPDGTFRPDTSVTGLESIIMTSGLLKCVTGINYGTAATGTINWELIPLWARKIMQEETALRIAKESQLYGVKQVNRLQFAVMLAKALRLQPATILQGAMIFQDQDSISATNMGYILTLKKLNIVVGDNGNFYPDRLVTRAEAAVMLSKVLNILNTMTTGSQINNDTLIIALDENPTTGYGWNVRMNVEGILKLESDKFVSNDSTGTIVGGGGVHEWTFKGLTKGTVILTFKYFRPWENESTAIETKVFTVEVGDAGKIISSK